MTSFKVLSRLLLEELKKTKKNVGIVSLWADTGTQGLPNTNNFQRKLLQGVPRKTGPTHQLSTNLRI
jgi:hypothetical protein